MALLPDPTTAASEPSSVKNRLTGSRRRGPGINRHRSRTVSKTSLRGRHRVQAHPGRCRARASETSRKTRIRRTFRAVCEAQHAAANKRLKVLPPRRTPFEGGQGGPGGPGLSRGGSGRKNQEKRSGTVWLPTAQQHPGFCAGGSSRPNGSGYPLSVPAVAHPPPPDIKVLEGEKGQVSNTPIRVGGYICMYIYIYTDICICCCCLHHVTHMYMTLFHYLDLDLHMFTHIATHAQFNL